MVHQDFSILDLPRTEPVHDPEAYLHAAIDWHFGPDTGSRYWLERAQTLDFDPRAEIKTFDDLARFPNVVDEWRDVDIADLIPAGYGPDGPGARVFESGGTTGAPKRVVILPDWEQQNVAWDLAEVAERIDPGVVRGRGMLLASANGPHAIGYTQARLAESLGCALFTVDMDPRWVKKIAARGAESEVGAYVDHIVEQAGYILATQDISVMMTTPPLLTAMARRDDVIEAIAAKVRLIKLGGAHLDEDTRLIYTEMFPDAELLNVYGSTMVLGQAHTRRATTRDEPVIHDGRGPYITFTVVDPDTAGPVPYGERGQVVMNHISRSMFIPNNLERDTALRVPAPEGQVGDSLSDIQPAAAFNGAAVIEGVY